MPGEIKMLGPEGEMAGGAFTVPDDMDPSEIPARLTEALTAAFSSGASSTPDPALAPDVLIPRLVAVCERYVLSYGTLDNKACPFRVGSLVTPVEGSGYRGAGEPHIVLETRKTEPDFEPCEGGPTSNAYGGRRDVRVGYFGKKPGRPGVNYASFWVESFEFQPYTP